jgi:hypothetical protein
MAWERRSLTAFFGKRLKRDYKAVLLGLQLTGLFWSSESHDSPSSGLSFLLLFARGTESSRSCVAHGRRSKVLDRTIELFSNYGLKPQQVTEVQKLIEEHIDAIRSAWAKHFPS